MKDELATRRSIKDLTPEDITVVMKLMNAMGSEQDALQPRHHESPRINTASPYIFQEAW